MNRLVCVKQVPDTAEIRIDPETHTLIREGVASILNPYDGYALELALRQKEADGGTVSVLSMGPPQAESVLRKCLSVGADEAFLACDRLFGGADTLATSYVLSAAVSEAERICGCSFDLILCGKQAIDGDTGQVGPALAELLGIPHITYARALSYEHDAFQVCRQTNQGTEILCCAAPLMVTVTATDFDLRLPSIKGKLASKKKIIHLLTAADLDVLPERCGLKGSPTRVVRTFTPTLQGHCTNIAGKTAAEQAQMLVSQLRKTGLLGEELPCN